MYVLGIDGGGTKTQAVILDQGGRFLGQGLAGTSNHYSVGVEGMQQAVVRSVNTAAITAGIDRMHFTAIFAGFAGCIDTEDRALLAEAIADLELGETVRVHHDCYVALAGATCCRPGVVLISGTGSSCFGLDEAGAERLVGGWGHLIGDEGSSFDIGRRALIAAARASDGRAAPTLLLDALQKRLGVREPRSLIRKLYHGEDGSVRAIAALAPLVLTAAKSGDAVALEILADSARALASHALAVTEGLRFTRGFELALIGGTFSADGLYAEAVESELARLIPHAHIIRPRFQPGVGAALAALASSGVEPARVIPTLERSLTERFSSPPTAPGAPIGRSQPAEEGV